MSAPSAILDATNIDTNLFSYSAPKANAAGGKVVNLFNSQFKESLTIALPLMPSWGAQEVMENKKEGDKMIKVPTGKYTMTMQFPSGEYATTDTDRALEEFVKLEQKIKSDAMTYSKEWFGKTITSMEVMDEKISPMLKYPKIKDSEERDYSKKPSLQVKIPCWNGVWQPSIFDEEYNQLYVKGKSEPDVTPLEFLKGTGKGPIYMVALIQCGGLWFVGSPAKVSITWNLKQAIVRRPRMSSIQDDTCFLSIKPADREALKALPQPERVIEDDNVVTSTIVNDSDDEADRPLPPPPKAVAAAAAAEPAPAVKRTVEETPAAGTDGGEPAPKKKKIISSKKA